MATTQSTYTRLQTSLETTWLPLGIAVTPLTRPRPTPFRKPAPASSLCTLPKEPEDARLTGGTRSLDRRLLALNLSLSPVKAAAASERKSVPPRADAA